MLTERQPDSGYLTCLLSCRHLEFDGSEMIFGYLVGIGGPVEILNADQIANFDCQVTMLTSHWAVLIDLKRLNRTTSI